MQIQEILKTFTVDRKHIQAVGNMVVVPITSDHEFTDVADAHEITLTRDHTYNRMEFKNNSSRVGIVIQGYTLINDQRAQDRTVPYAHLIKAANTKIIPANCVQSHQCGTFNANQIRPDDFMILPPSIRGMALARSTYSEGETGALWDYLRTWSRSMDCRENGLRQFYSKFKDNLDIFVAQFEPVEKQLGAIVLINGKVVAIDIMPKYATWKAVWRTLIRDSYGAEAVRMGETGSAVLLTANIKSDDVKTVDDLETAFESAKAVFYDEIQSLVGNAVQLSVGVRELERTGELTMVKLESEHYSGQGVMHGSERFIYVSLIPAGATAEQKERFESLRPATLRSNPYGTTGFRFH